MIWIVVAMCHGGCGDEPIEGSGSNLNDDATDGRETGAPVDSMTRPDVGDAAPYGGAGGRDPQANRDGAAQDSVGWIAVSLVPRRFIYTVDDRVTAQATLYDREGRRMHLDLSAPPVNWRVEPPGMARVADDGGLDLLAEGSGAVLACASGVCGRVAFIVDNGPPQLIVESPTGGAVLGGDGTETISVRGAASDTNGPVTVRVNGIDVELDAAGRFGIDLPARFGLNTIRITVDDGVRGQPVRAVREVLWAPRYQRAHESSLLLQPAATLRIGQSLVDRDAPNELPDGLRLEAHDLAQLLAYVVMLVEPQRIIDGLLGEQQGGIDGLRGLTLGDIRVGVPDVALAWARSGVELFLRLSAVEIDTHGGVDLDGGPVSLAGTVRLGLAGSTQAYLALQDGRLAIEPGPTVVAVESVTGRMSDSAAQALLATAESRLRAELEAIATDLIEQLVGDHLANLLGTFVSTLLEQVAHVPVRVQPVLEGATSVNFDLRLRPSRLVLRRALALEVEFDALIEHPSPVSTEHDDPGSAVLPGSEPVHFGDVPLGMAVKLDLLNAVLHEAWRAGLLRINASLPGILGDRVEAILVDGKLPPLVIVRTAPIDGADLESFPLELQVGEISIRVRMTQSGDSDAAGVHEDEYALGLRARMVLASDDQRIAVLFADRPTIEVRVVGSSDDQLWVPPSAIRALVEATLWPQIAASVAQGLALPLSAVNLDADSVRALAPSVMTVTLGPRLRGPSTLRGGWVVLDGGLDAVIELVAPADPP